MKNLFNIKILIIFTISMYYSSIILGNSFVDTLDYYGFADKKQKQALQDLLQKADIIPANVTLDQAFPQRKKKEEIASDIINVLQKIQEKFIARSGLQERWQVKSLKWLEQDKEQILADLRILGFVDAIKPKQKNIDAVCILGARTSWIVDRIEYANSLLQTNNISTKKIILLTGESNVTKGIDGSESELSRIAAKFKIADWTKLTETHLMQHEYSKSPLFNNKDIDVHIIDTPKGDLPRPTTQTTVIKLIEWLKDHEKIKNIIFVSNQPYIKYQKAVIDAVFKEKKVDIRYEVIGSTAQNLGELQPILEGLGSYIWASTLAVLSEMNIQVTDETNKQLLKDLYLKNPLIYKIIPQSL